MRRVNGLAVQLGQQDMGDGANYGLGSTLKQVGKADEDLAFAKTDGGVERSETAQTDMDGRHGRPRAKDPVLFLKNGSKIDVHQFAA